MKGPCFFAFIALTTLSACNNEEPDEPVVCPDGTTANIVTVFEWTPAPGQFINEVSNDQIWSDDVTASEAAQWALERLTNHLYVSLGGFGGYLVAGFDHPVKASTDADGYEIGIVGNAFNSAAGDSNEPGIVYVMQDANKNGLPDDVWYELAGSDTFAPGTDRDYAVTYYRPEGPGQAVRWTDNRGGEGKVPYLGFYHKQDTYYPVWVKENQYTLSGTCLQARTTSNPATGNWNNPPFGWGYADNMGSDAVEWDGFPNCNRFRIADAVDAQGRPVHLPYINFVKVQTGVNAVAGWLGEVSTEILDIVDLTLLSQYSTLD